MSRHHRSYKSIGSTICWWIIYVNSLIAILKVLNKKIHYVLCIQSQKFFSFIILLGNSFKWNIDQNKTISSVFLNRFANRNGKLRHKMLKFWNMLTALLKMNYLKERRSVRSDVRLERWKYSMNFNSNYSKPLFTVDFRGREKSRSIGDRCISQYIILFIVYILGAIYKGRPHCQTPPPPGRPHFSTKVDLSLMLFNKNYELNIILK